MSHWHLGDQRGKPMVNDSFCLANDSQDEFANTWYVVDQALDLSSPINTGGEVAGFKDLTPACPSNERSDVVEGRVRPLQNSDDLIADGIFADPRRIAQLAENKIGRPL